MSEVTAEVVPVTEQKEVDNNVYLVLGDAKFVARKTAPRWAFIKFTAAQKSKDDIKMTEALYSFALALVVESERERLDDYLMEEEEAFDLLMPAIEDLSNAWNGRPLESPASSTVSSQTEAQQPTSQVVSFSQGTVETVPAEG